MRVMQEKWGIILLDGAATIVVRVYLLEDLEKATLLHHWHQNPTNFKVESISEALAEIFSSNYASGVSEWFVYARGIPYGMIQGISLVTKLKIDNLTLVREQELIGKGVLWELIKELKHKAGRV